MASNPTTVADLNKPRPTAVGTELRSGKIIPAPPADIDSPTPFQDAMDGSDRTKEGVEKDGNTHGTTPEKRFAMDDEMRRDREAALSKFF